MDLNTKVSIASVITAFISCFVAIRATAHSKRSANEAKRSADLAEASFKAASYEMINSLPAVDILGTVKVGDKTRVKLIVFNLREKPFKIEAVRVDKYAPVRKTITNIVKNWLEPFDWNYRQVENIFWNPKGKLDDSEYYVADAAQFSLVKEKEVVLVTIPNFEENRYERYRFSVNTTFGEIKIESTLDGDRTLFSTEYRKVIT